MFVISCGFVSIEFTLKSVTQRETDGCGLVIRRMWTDGCGLGSFRRCVSSLTTCVIEEEEERPQVFNRTFGKCPQKTEVGNRKFGF